MVGFTVTVSVLGTDREQWAQLYNMITGFDHVTTALTVSSL